MSLLQKIELHAGKCADQFIIYLDAKMSKLNFFLHIYGTKNTYINVIKQEEITICALIR